MLALYYWLIAFVSKPALCFCGYLVFYSLRLRSNPSEVSHSRSYSCNTTVMRKTACVLFHLPYVTLNRCFFLRIFFFHSKTMYTLVTALHVTPHISIYSSTALSIVPSCFPGGGWVWLLPLHLKGWDRCSGEIPWPKRWSRCSRSRTHTPIFWPHLALPWISSRFVNRSTAVLRFSSHGRFVTRSINGMLSTFYLVDLVIFFMFVLCAQDHRVNGRHKSRKIRSWSGMTFSYSIYSECISYGARKAVNITVISTRRTRYTTSTQTR